MDKIYVALDLETTGLQSRRDAIIEIGAVKFRIADDWTVEQLDTWHSLVNPQRRLPFKIQQLTGITQEELNAAPALHTLSRDVERFVGRNTVIGHNVQFDLDFLNAQNLLLGVPGIDTFNLACILIPDAHRYKLSSLAKIMGIEFPTQHRALEDATVTARLFAALAHRAAQVDATIIRELNQGARNAAAWRLRGLFIEIEKWQARHAFAVNEQASTPKGASRKTRRETRLSPKSEKQKIDDAELCSLFASDGSEGLIAQHFKSYEYRPEQIEMLQAVVRAFNTDHHLLVEAGTGVGKSLAYLAPAIYYAVANDEHVIISTNTINLQDQLYTKDVPDLQKILPLNFKTALLKGRTNYICRQRLEKFRHKEHLSPTEVNVLAKVLIWLPQTETGDRAELTLINKENYVWHELSAEAETCLYDRCPHRVEKRCFFYRAHEHAEASHLIIVNHALLLSNVVMEDRVLPDYRYLVIDEAHHLEARATDQLSFVTTRKAMETVLSQLSRPVGREQYSGSINELLGFAYSADFPESVLQELREYTINIRRDIDRAYGMLDEFFLSLTAFVDEMVEQTRGNPNYDCTIRLLSAIRRQSSWESIEMTWENLALQWKKVIQGVARLLRGWNELAEEYDLEDSANVVANLNGYGKTLQEIHVNLNKLIAQPTEDDIYWLNVRRRDGEVSLHVAPLHVGNLLYEKLFEPKHAIVMTSATLQSAGGNYGGYFEADELIPTFHFIKDRLNLKDFREVALGSPFDYESSTLLYVPTDIPEPNQPNHQKIISRGLIELCRAMEGRTLVLFTSYSQLRASYKTISKPLADDEIAVLGQGIDGNRRQLLENFKTGERVVLLGTRSFWEGVDVVGPALSCVVLARLPFDVPSDPVFAARSETYDNAFMQYSVPQATLRFRQGFGRLIRTKTDRGVVVILDKRVISKFYGAAFLQALPTCTTQHGAFKDMPQAAAEWMRVPVSRHR